MLGRRGEGTIGRGLSSLAPEYSTAVSRFEVVLIRPQSMYPEQPCSSAVKKDSGSAMVPPSPRYSGVPDGSFITRETLTMAEMRTKMVVEKRFFPSK